jgi:cyclic pyranopterin phosphate synthase
MSAGDAMARLAEHAPLDPAPDKPHGHGPARYYLFRGAHVGFIGSVTCADFCTTCNKLRLTADGKLRPCLGRHGEIDLMPALRGDPAESAAAVRSALEESDWVIITGAVSKGGRDFVPTLLDSLVRIAHHRA